LDEEAGCVSRSFKDWFLIDRDQRVFLRLGLNFAHHAYDRLWKDIAEQPGDPDLPDVPDQFNDAIGGVWPGDFEWMHLAGVMRDAVTNFDVYLERSADEILTFHGKTFPDRKRSARWEKLVEFYELVGVDLTLPAVRDARDLRHVLTHRRGELRTEEQRAKFAESKDPFMRSVAHLNEAVVQRRMDDLGEAVRLADRVGYDHTWGSVRSQAILDLTADPLQRRRRTQGSAQSDV
jgi:hypothetical protein